MWCESSYFANIVSKNDRYRLRKRIIKCWSYLLCSLPYFPGKRTEVQKSYAFYQVTKLASGRNGVRTQVSDGACPLKLKWHSCFCFGWAAEARGSARTSRAGQICCVPSFRAGSSLPELCRPSPQCFSEPVRGRLCQPSLGQSECFYLLKEEFVSKSTGLGCGGW